MATDWPFILSIVIFLMTYALIITEHIHRAVVALSGAGLMIIAQQLFTGDDAFVDAVFKEYIEWETVSLLIGMMILVGITAKTGVFQYVAVKTAKLVRGNPIRLLLALSGLTAFASAFLDNVTTVLLIVPVTFSITRLLQLNPIPYLIAEVMASNIGGTATLIGDPPNIMIGQANPELTFNAFLLNLGPVIALIMMITLFLLYLIYRKQLKSDPEKIELLMSLKEEEYISDPMLLRKSLAVLSLTICGFLLHAVFPLHSAVVATLGATVLMLIGLRKEQVEEAFDYVEWSTIFFFIGLFTLVGGLQSTGVIERLAALFLDWTHHDLAASASVILWGSGIASGFIDNIPFVTAMIPLIETMGSSLQLSPGSFELNTLWWSLALGACLGGNATIIGASANVIVAGLAAREGTPISYWQFLKIGLPLTLVSLAVAHLYIYFRYLIFL